MEFIFFRVDGRINRAILHARQGRSLLCHCHMSMRRRASSFLQRANFTRWKEKEGNRKTSRQPRQLKTCYSVICYDWDKWFSEDISSHMLKALKEKFIEIDFIRYNIGIASGGEEWGKRTKRQKIEKNTVQRSYSRKPVIFVSARCSKFRGQFSGSSRHVGLEDTNFQNEVLLDLTFFSPFFNNVPCSVNPNFFFF